MFEGLVSTLNVFYSLHEPYATIRFSGDNDPALFFVIMHQSLMYRDACDVQATVEIYEFLGDASSPKFDVEDKDVLIIVAKRHDSIVASHVYEVDFGATHQSGYLLLPRGGYNLLVEQNEQEPVVESLEEEVRPTIPVMASHLPWYA